MDKLSRLVFFLLLVTEDLAPGGAANAKTSRMLYVAIGSAGSSLQADAAPLSPFVLVAAGLLIETDKLSCMASARRYYNGRSPSSFLGSDPISNNAPRALVPKQQLPAGFGSKKHLVECGKCN